MNVKELLSNAYKDAQIRHEKGDEITTDDLQRGIRSLNFVLRGMNLDKDLITYRTEETLTFTPNSEIINVNFVEIDVFYYLLGGSVRYVIYPQSLRNYFKKASVVSAAGVPSISFSEPKPDFTIDLYVYLKPTTNWTFTIHGRRALTELHVNDVLPADLFPYEMYLTYATGAKLRNTMNLEPNRELNAMVQQAQLQLLSNKSYEPSINVRPAGRALGDAILDSYLGGIYP